MKITIRKSDFDRIYEHAFKERPDEACGLVAGIDREDGVREIRKVYLLTNIDHTNEHFSIDPKEHLKAVKDMRAEGLKPLGNWHSHPETPSRPSEEDKRLANDPRGQERRITDFRGGRLMAETEIKVDDKIDITDVVCPVTFVKTKVALEEIDDGQILQVHLNDGEPVQNVPRSVKDEGHQILKLTDNEDGTYELFIKKVGD